MGETFKTRRFWAVNCTKNAFGGQVPPRPTGGAIALPQTPSHYKGEGKERVGNRGEKGKEVKG